MGPGVDSKVVDRRIIVDEIELGTLLISLPVVVIIGEVAGVVADAPIKGLSVEPSIVSAKDNKS